LSELFSQTLQAFAQRFPDVQLTLVESASGSLHTHVLDGRIDVGMSRLLPEAGQTGVEALSLGQEPLVAALCSDNPLAEQDEVTLAQLSEYPLILFPSDYGSGLNGSIEHLYQRRGWRYARAQRGARLPRSSPWWRQAKVSRWCPSAPAPWPGKAWSTAPWQTPKPGYTC